VTHTMKLHPGPFTMIRSGQKTIELRLYDEKRRAIHVGDTLIFSHSNAPEQTISALVTALHIFPDFAALYDSLPLDQCGYLPGELSSADPSDMNAYYSEEQQMKWGVVGIEIQQIGE